MHLPDGYGAEMDETRRATKGALRGEWYAHDGTAEGRLNTSDAATAGRVVKLATRRLPAREDGSLKAPSVPTLHSSLRQDPSGVAGTKRKGAAVVSTQSYVVHGGKPTPSACGSSVRDTGTAGSVGDPPPPKKAPLSRALFAAMLDVFGPKPGFQERAPHVASTAAEKISHFDTVPLPHKSAKRTASSAAPCWTVAAAGQSDQSAWDASGTASNSEPFIEDVEMEDLSEAIDKGFNTLGPLSDYRGTYVVTDTNIFLGHLDLVKRVMEPRTGAEDMIVFIPWMAIQELDNIKNKKQDMLSRSAVAAISYIYKALASKNPRLRGQTIAEARSKDDCLPKDGLDISDDHFLHCCLTLQNQGNRVLLVSDDRNLRNKAMINDIEAVSTRQLGARLGGPRLGRQRTLPSAPPPDQLPTTTKPPVQTYLDEKAAKTEACDILKKSLSLVLENELESAFGDLWPRVVFIPPPWNEQTALECILKHWIALRGTAFKSSLKPTMQQLLDVLKSPTADGKLSRLLNLSITVCSELQLHYIQLAEGVARLWELRTAVTTKQSRPPKPASEVMGISGDSSRIRVQHPHGGHEVGDSQRPPAFPSNPAAQLLDDVWPLINDYCGNLCQLLGKQHLFAYVEHPSFTLDWFTVHEVSKRVTLTMNFLGSAGSYLLNLFPCSLLYRYNEGRENLVGAANAFVNTLVELGKLLLHKAGLPDVDWNVTGEDMLDHFLDPEKKNIMAMGHRQIVTLHNVLAHYIVPILEPVTADAF
ncbi:swt1 RNA endoribonuclease isoform X2 [Amblyomma americanum]